MDFVLYFHCVMHEFDSRFSLWKLNNQSKTARFLSKRIQKYLQSSHHSRLLVDISSMKNKVGIFRRRY